MSDTPKDAGAPPALATEAEPVAAAVSSAQDPPAALTVEELQAEADRAAAKAAVDAKEAELAQQRAAQEAAIAEQRKEMQSQQPAVAAAAQRAAEVSAEAAARQVSLTPTRRNGRRRGRLPHLTRNRCTPASRSVVVFFFVELLLPWPVLNPRPVL